MQFNTLFVVSLLLSFFMLSSTSYAQRTPTPQGYTDYWSQWIFPHHPLTSGTGTCQTVASLTLAEALLNKKMGLAWDGNYHVKLKYDTDVTNPDYLEYRYPSKVESPSQWPNYPNTYWNLSEAQNNVQGNPTSIKAVLPYSPVYAKLNRDGNPGDDHAVVIVGYNDNLQKYWVFDPEDGDFSDMGYYQYDVDSFTHYWAAVNSSSLAKIAPSIFATGTSFSNSLDYEWDSNEWAILDGALTGDLLVNSGAHVKGYSSNGVLYGDVNFTNVSNAKLQDLEVKGTITVNNSSGIYLTNITSALSSPSEYALDIYDGGPFIVNFTTNSSGYDGIYARYYSSPSISNASLTEWQKAIRVGSTSFSTVTGVDFCQNTYDIYAESGAYDSDAYDSNIFSSSQYGGSIYGPVNIPAVDDWDWCGYSKNEMASYSSEDAILFQGSDPVSDFEKGLAIYKNVRLQILHRLHIGEMVHAKEYESDLLEAVQLLKGFTSELPNSPEAVHALTIIGNVYDESGLDELAYSYFTSIAQNDKLDLLKPHALRLLVLYFFKHGNAARALALSDEILENYSSDKDLAVEVLYGKGLIYRHALYDNLKAVDIFNEVIAQYPYHPTAQSAKSELQALGMDEAKPASKNDLKTQVTTGSFPNPFSSTATIRFEVTNPSQVNLKVYDVLGREITTLVDAYLEEGFHSSVFDGSELQNGLYIYRLKIEDALLIGNMILIR